MSSTGYIPPLGFHFLTRFYDPFISRIFREDAIKSELVRHANISSRHRVLDLGCGTGTLTLMIKDAHPQAKVVGIDPDASALKIASNKAGRRRGSVTFEQGRADCLPFEEKQFDRVVSCLVFHHLDRGGKKKALSEIFRVLKPGGELHLADWGKARNWLARFAYLSVQLTDGFNTTTDNVLGRMPDFLTTAGFADVETSREYTTSFGTFAFYKGRKAKRPRG